MKLFLTLFKSQSSGEYSRTQECVVVAGVPLTLDFMIWNTLDVYGLVMRIVALYLFLERKNVGRSGFDGLPDPLDS